MKAKSVQIVIRVCVSVVDALELVFLACVSRQVEDQKEDMTTLQERQRDLFETIKSLEKDIQVRSRSTWRATVYAGLELADAYIIGSAEG